MTRHPDLDRDFRTTCAGCDDDLLHDGTFWAGFGYAGKRGDRPDYGCVSSSHGDHSPRLSWTDRCVDCGEGEGTLGYRLLVPLKGGRWRHLRKEHCAYAEKLAAGRRKPSSKVADAPRCPGCKRTVWACANDPGKCLRLAYEAEKVPE